MGTSVFSRLAVIGVLAAALALGACGRKGPLEVPPSANAVAAVPPQQGPSLGEGDPQGFEGQRDELPAPQANRKSFVLDPLLKDDAPPRRKAVPPPTR